MSNCEKFAPLLSAYADRELSTSESLLVRQHLYVCEECTAQVKMLEGIRALMLELPAAPEPKVDFNTFYAANRPRPVKRIPIALAIASVAVVASLLIPAMTRADRLSKDATNNQELRREIARDQMISAEADPTSGAALVHFAGYSR